MVRFDRGERAEKPSPANELHQGLFPRLLRYRNIRPPVQHIADSRPRHPRFPGDINAANWRQGDEMVAGSTKYASNRLPFEGYDHRDRKDRVAEDQEQKSHIQPLCSRGYRAHFGESIQPPNRAQTQPDEPSQDTKIPKIKLTNRSKPASKTNQPKDAQSRPEPCPNQLVRPARRNFKVSNSNLHLDSLWGH